MSFECISGKTYCKSISISSTSLGRTNESSPCVLQDFVPFGAAALLPLTQIHTYKRVRSLKHAHSLAAAVGCPHMVNVCSTYLLNHLDNGITCGHKGRGYQGSDCEGRGYQGRGYDDHGYQSRSYEGCGCGTARRQH